MNVDKKIIGSWNLMYHLPQDKNWTLSSYKYIMKEINTIDKVIALRESISDNLIKYCMLYIMKEGITPMWEDQQNRNGGCFSYKVVNSMVPDVWNELMYALCGHTLTKKKNHMDFITGITISPKRNFCIIKIWLSSCKFQDPTLITPIENLTKMGCFFKKHEPEF
jgi:hypothetical protein